MGKFFVYLLSLLTLPMMVFASVEFVSLFPNPYGDDAVAEYIELRNLGCEDIDISHYELRDLQKNYFFATGTILLSHSGRLFPYSETKISLNNSGIEALTLLDRSGSIIDIYSYSGTQSEGYILVLPYVDDICSVNTSSGQTSSGSTGETLPTEENSASGSVSGSGVISSSGITDTGSSYSGSMVSSGTTASGVFMTGGTSNDSSYSGEITSTGQAFSGSSASGNTQTGSIMGTGMLDVSASGTQVSFPPIIPVLQSPTNAVFSDDIFTCRSQDCRINLTYTSIFTGSFKSSQFLCYFGTGEILDYDSDCNPSTYYFSVPGVLNMVLESRIMSGQSIQKNYEIVFDIPDDSSERSDDANIMVASNTQLSDMQVPVAIIDIDGALKDYHEAVSDDEMICNVLTCAINLTGENSYDPDKTNLVFSWKFSSTDISPKKDPGERKFGLGDHTIVLEVRDTVGNIAKKEFVLRVVGPSESLPSTKTDAEKITDEKTSGKSNTSKKFPQFILPKLILQSTPTSNKTYSGLTICRTTGKTCSFNFSLTDTSDEVMYEWRLPDGGVLNTVNPRSFSLPTGEHRLVLHAIEKDSGKEIFQESYALEVLKIIPPAKPKKVSTKNANIIKKGTTTSKLLTGATIPISSDIISEEIFPEDIPYTIIYLSLGGIFLVLFRRRIFTSFE